MTAWSEESTIASLNGLKNDSPFFSVAVFSKKNLPPVAIFARVVRFRLHIGIGVARLPWVVFPSGMSDSEEEIGVARLPWIIFPSGMSESESEEEFVNASSYLSSAPLCSYQLFARRSDMIDFP